MPTSIVKSEESATLQESLEYLATMGDGDTDNPLMEDLGEHSSFSPANFFAASPSLGAVMPEVILPNAHGLMQDNDCGASIEKNAQASVPLDGNKNMVATLYQIKAEPGDSPPMRSQISDNAIEPEAAKRTVPLTPPRTENTNGSSQHVYEAAPADDLFVAEEGGLQQQYVLVNNPLSTTHWLSNDQAGATSSPAGATGDASVGRVETTQPAFPDTSASVEAGSVVVDHDVGITEATVVTAPGMIVDPFKSVGIGQGLLAEPVNGLAGSTVGADPGSAATVQPKQQATHTKAATTAHHTTQNKRRSPFDNTIPDHELTEEQLAKRIRRRQRNKESAQQSRLRKKQFIDTLGEQVNTLAEANLSLQQKLEQIIRENTILRNAITSHQVPLPDEVSGIPHQPRLETLQLPDPSRPTASATTVSKAGSVAPVTPITTTVNAVMAIAPATVPAITPATVPAAPTPAPAPAFFSDTSSNAVSNERKSPDTSQGTVSSPLLNSAMLAQASACLFALMLVVAVMLDPRTAFLSSQSSVPLPSSGHVATGRSLMAMDDVDVAAPPQNTLAAESAPLYPSPDLPSPDLETHSSPDKTALAVVSQPLLPRPPAPAKTEVNEFSPSIPQVDSYVDGSEYEYDVVSKALQMFPASVEFEHRSASMYSWQALEFIRDHGVPETQYIFCPKAHSIWMNAAQVKEDLPGSEDQLFPSLDEDSNQSNPASSSHLVSVVPQRPMQVQGKSQNGPHRVAMLLPGGMLSEHLVTKHDGDEYAPKRVDHVSCPVMMNVTRMHDDA